jgi:hypothetical protein
VEALIKHKINNDPNYIHIRRFEYSLSKLLERYPEGVPDKYIAQALDIEEEEVDALYEQTVQKLRKLMNVTV